MNISKEKQTITQVVTEQIRRKILSGHLAAGAVLRQDAIAADFAVSRIPVREALRQLEAEGLVTFYAHRGAVVSSLSPKDLDELFELRILIEPKLLLDAVPKLTPRDLKAAERFLQASWKVHSPERILPGWDFYATIYGPANKPRQLELVRGLHNQTNRYWVSFSDAPESRNGSRVRREGILKALGDGKPEQAADLLAEHFETCRRMTAEHLAAQPVAAVRKRLKRAV